MLEFKLMDGFEESVPKKIGFNFEELKTELAERLDHYNHLVVTEDGIKDAKKDRASLNALKTAIDTRRKSIKKEYLKPYNDFEAKVKELTSLIDEPIRAIDTQLNDYETQRIEAKKKECEAAYAEVFTGEIAQLFPYGRIAATNWYNKSTTMATVRAELQEKRARIDADMLVLNTVAETWKAPARNMYEQTMDITGTMNWVKRQQEAAEARRKVEEMAAEARRKAQEAAQQEETTKTTSKLDEAPQSQQTATEPKQYKLRLEFDLTMNQAKMLRDFIAANHITYHKI